MLRNRFIELSPLRVRSLHGGRSRVPSAIQIPPIMQKLRYNIAAKISHSHLQLVCGLESRPEKWCARFAHIQFQVLQFKQDRKTTT